MKDDQKIYKSLTQNINTLKAIGLNQPRNQLSQNLVSLFQINCHKLCPNTGVRKLTFLLKGEVICALSNTSFSSSFFFF